MKDERHYHKYPIRWWKTHKPKTKHMLRFWDILYGGDFNDDELEVINIQVRTLMTAIPDKNFGIGSAVELLFKIAPYYIER